MFFNIFKVNNLEEFMNKVKDTASETMSTIRDNVSDTVYNSFYCQIEQYPLGRLFAHIEDTEEEGERRLAIRKGVEVLNDTIGTIYDKCEDGQKEKIDELVNSIEKNHGLFLMTSIVRDTVVRKVSEATEGNVHPVESLIEKSRCTIGYDDSLKLSDREILSMFVGGDVADILLSTIPKDKKDTPAPAEVDI